MVSLDLSQHLEAPLPHNTCECDGASQPQVSCRDCRDAKSRQKRLDNLKVSRVKTNRGAGDETVSCLSFRQVSSLGILFLLSNVLIDMTVLCVVLGASISTVTMARELRHETLEQRKEREVMRQSMLLTSLELRLAMRELERAESELALTMPRSAFHFDEEPESWSS